MTEPATEKQKKFMDDLKIPYSQRVTKQEAKQLIQQKLDNGDSKKESEVPEIGIIEQFHLSPEQVASNALETAFKWQRYQQDDNIDNLIKIADRFKEWIYGN